MSENGSEQKPNSQMLINYVPGEECRVALVEDGKLEEYHVERFASASRVGNIYVGKVMNVEPAIQAAFVDFGVGDNGFLHMSDLHPRYFPGEEADTTERVGFKTPRRERPPIQACLRRGDEVIVQVLKEGVGTKGPTVTSYLSIPGRFLVMMPYMDRTGVSRKVEDEDQRRRMREILDQLELPDGFGFIVRTAGLECNKMELKRDLAYLQRLWKDMERRLTIGDKPRQLYSESDLLVRSLRDGLGSEVGEVIIDHDIALNRAARFMKIVSPRGQARLLQHKSPTPIFHAFGIEQQVALIHAREVPLPSGGRLVIDQTEAIVAIDVNSGKSRDSRNSEENAFQTNLEAVDEICRQLRLRDMGGIVINDLIDMRHASHRKEVEARFHARLKRDRARSTVLPISEFGILELTRQRMRPSHESVHFTDCPMCRGRGMVQRPDSIASDALRDLAMVLDVPKIARVEMAVAPRVAGEFLSTKRHILSRIERVSGKTVDMRVSEQVAVDRVMFYAYDADGADVDLTNLPRPKKPKDLVEFDLGNASDAIADEDTGAPPPEAEPEPLAEDVLDLHPIEQDGPSEPTEGWNAPPTGEEQGRRGRRRRGRGKGRDGDRPQQSGQSRQPQGAHAGRGGPTHAQPGTEHGGRQGDQRQGRSHADQHPHRGAQPPVRLEPKPMPRRDIPAAGVPAATAGFAGDHGDDDAAPAPPTHEPVHENGFAGVHDETPAGTPTHAGDAADTGTQFLAGPADQNGQGVPGESGGRRRRRRRRGRGRGRGGTDGQVDGPGGQSAGQGAAPTNQMPGDESSGTPTLPSQQHADADFAGDHDDGADDANSATPAPAGPDAGQNGERGEGGRRRRRRRRGRGGRGGGDPDQGAQQSGQGGQAPQNSGQHPNNPPQGGGNRGGYRNDRYTRGGSPQSDRPQGSPPTPPPRVAPPSSAQPPASSGASGEGEKSVAPKPRLLFSMGRRKLNASELNRRPKPE